MIFAINKITINLQVERKFNQYTRGSEHTRMLHSADDIFEAIGVSTSSI